MLIRENPRREALLQPHDTHYFSPGRATFVINYRVENLDALLSALNSDGVVIDPRREDCEYGRLAWIVDPEGNRIELWDPPNTRVRAKSAKRRKPCESSFSPKKKSKKRPR